MFLDQVKVAHHGSILGQNPYRPAWLLKNGLQTPPSHDVLLRPRTPGIHGCAQLNHPPISPAGCVPGNLFRNIRVNDAVAVFERAFASVLEADMAPQEGTAGTVGAAVPALDSDVHRKLSQFLLGKFRRRSNAVTEWVSVNSESISHDSSFVVFRFQGGSLNASWPILRYGRR